MVDMGFHMNLAPVIEVCACVVSGAFVEAAVLSFPELPQAARLRIMVIANRAILSFFIVLLLFVLLSHHNYL